MKPNGDYFAHQEKFVRSLLEKYGYAKHKGNNCVQIDRVPDQPDPPSPKLLKELQGFSGEFNWLATRTRPDLGLHTMFPC